MTRSCMCGQVRESQSSNAMSTSKTCQCTECSGLNIWLGYTISYFAQTCGNDG